MATLDAPNVSANDARPRNALPWGARLLVTVGLLALYYYWGHRLTLPFVTPERAGRVARFSWPFAATMSRSSPLRLGLRALFLGFVLVELFSVATSPGRRLRQAGAAGRARLNLAALVTSLMVGALQGLGTAFFLESTPNPVGEPFVTHPGLGFVLIATMTVTGSTAALFVLANLISDYGIGNGFALLNLVELGVVFLSSLTFAAGLEDAGSPVMGLWLIGLAVLTLLLVRYVRRAEATYKPAFPQGVLAVVWLGSILSVTISLLRILLHTEVLRCAVVAIVVALFSWIGFHLFSNRRRLEANVPEPAEVLDHLAGLLRGRLPFAVALQIAGVLTFMVWQQTQPLSFLALSGFLSLVVMVATGFDLADQYRFMKRNGLTTRLVQLDNVHFSYRLAERLEEAGIDALARGHAMRSLYFFLGPLYKIDVLVPVKDLADARGVLTALESAREVKVF